MSKKLQGNGLWESSRMMLPEHKEQILQYQHEAERKSKPFLDEQRVLELAALLSQAMAARTEVTLTLYDPFRSYQLSGFIEKADQERQSLKIRAAGQVIWVKWEDIVDLSLTV